MTDALKASAIAGFMALILFATLGATNSTTEAERLDYISMVQLSLSPCGNFCEVQDECTGSGITKHTYDTWEDGDFLGGTDDHCVHGSCEGDGHADCRFGEEEEEDRETVQVALTGLELLHGERLERLIDRNPHRLIFSDERGAVQVLGCSGRIVAHVPLTQEQLSSLASIQ